MRNYEANAIIEFTSEYLDEPDYCFMEGVDRGVKVRAHVPPNGHVFVLGRDTLAWCNMMGTNAEYMTQHDSDNSCPGWPFLCGEFKVVKWLKEPTCQN